MHNICSKLLLKVHKPRHSAIFIVNFEGNLHVALVPLLLILELRFVLQLRLCDFKKNLNIYQAISFCKAMNFLIFCILTSSCKHILNFQR